MQYLWKGFYSHIYIYLEILFWSINWKIYIYILPLCENKMSNVNMHLCICVLKKKTIWRAYPWFWTKKLMVTILGITVCKFGIFNVQWLHVVLEYWVHCMQYSRCYKYMKLNIHMCKKFSIHFLHKNGKWKLFIWLLDQLSLFYDTIMARKFIRVYANLLTLIQLMT